VNGCLLTESQADCKGYCEEFQADTCSLTLQLLEEMEIAAPTSTDNAGASFLNLQVLQEESGAATGVDGEASSAWQRRLIPQHFLMMTTAALLALVVLQF
jgi:hypothetical protein